MKGDFTRFTHRPEKHYTRVLKQQGRVQLDADWNEQAELFVERERRATADIVGPSGAPARGGGFKVGITADHSDLTISPGRFYVAGQVATAEPDPEGPPTYLQQPHLPDPDALDFAPGTAFGVYLDVWERHVSYLEDPDIREVALGGPDTATRVQTIWQVKAQALEPGKVGCDGRLPEWDVLTAPGSGRLTSFAEPVEESSDPCYVPAGAGYRGLENRLYRVEIHDAGDVDGATFKWSRDNGAVAFPILGFDDDQPARVQLGTTGRDRIMAVLAGNWVEVLDDDHILSNTPGTIVQVVEASEDGTILLASDVSGTVDLARHPIVRRWDQTDTDTTGLMTVTSDAVELEDGVFIKLSGSDFRTGDHWVIAARTAIRDVERLTQAPPRGIRHQYAPLALVEWEAGAAAPTVRDLRRVFAPVAEGSGCCAVTVGDGVESIGQYDDIQEAIDALRCGGTVCVRPGVYNLRAPIRIARNDVSLCGCGGVATIHAPAGEPAIVIEACERTRICDLRIRAENSRGAVVCAANAELDIHGCSIINSRPVPVRIIGRWDFRKYEYMAPEEESKVSASAEEREIPQSKQPPRPVATAPATPATPSAADSSDEEAAPSEAGPALRVEGCAGLEVSHCHLDGVPAVVAQATDVLLQQNAVRGGGLHFLDGCSDVRVASNDIAGGQGPGVALGGTAGSDKAEAGILRVRIVGNRITAMGGSGISTITSTGDRLDDMGELADVRIEENHIEGCAHGLPEPGVDTALGGIVLRESSHVRLHANRIQANGRTSKRPTPGVFVVGCAGLQITNNTILDNGSADFVSTAATVPQSGIMAFLVTGAELATMRKFSDDGSDGGTGTQNIRTGSPALVVHDNIVATPRGPALAGVALGPISAQDNNLTSHGIHGPYSAAALLGYSNAKASTGPDSRSSVVGLDGSVILISLGETQITHVIGQVGYAYAPKEYETAGSSGHDAGSGGGSSTSTSTAGSSAEPAGNAPPQNRTLADDREAEAGSGKDDEHPTGDEAEEPTATPAMPDGRVRFAGNQVALLVADAGDQNLDRAVLVSSTKDDVSVDGNQIWSELRGGSLTANVQVSARTARALGNRMHELPGSADYSYLGSATWNMARDNIGTHCIRADGDPLAHDSNHEINGGKCAELVPGRTEAKG